MQGAFGLVALLIVIGIGLFIWSKSASVSIEKSKPALQQAHQMAGEDENGVKAKDSIKLEPWENNGKLQGMLVDQLAPEGPMAKYFGLKRDDIITSIGPLAVKDMGVREAQDWVLQAYTTKQKLIVSRGGEKIELPVEPLPKIENATKPPADDRSALDKQLDGIKNRGVIPTH